MSAAPFAPEECPDRVAWIAQDGNGAWWGYEHEPNQGDVGWYENEVGRYLRLGESAPPANWRTALRRVP
jgi:hypothetical protein